MQLVTVYTLSLYGLTALASSILARSETDNSENHTWWIPLVTWPVLVVAFLITERRNSWKLPAWLANLLGAASVATAAWEFATPSPEGKLLSGAHLLVYATWIVMFQEKTLRTYWWLMALGVLQVSVASVLTNYGWYGLSLLVYIGAALWTMSVASLYQIQQEFGGEGVLSKTVKAAAAKPIMRHFVQYDEHHRWLTRKFVGGWAFLVLVSLLVSAAFFAFTPRVWVGPRNIFQTEATAGGLDIRSATGFAREVRLGEMGPILESIKPVMDVRVFDALTDKPESLDKLAERMGMSEVMFRGVVLTDYSSRRSRWRPIPVDRPQQLKKALTSPGYRVLVDMEPTRDDVLFTIGLPSACKILGRSDYGFLHPSTGILTRENTPEAAERLTYSIFLEPPSREVAQLKAIVLPKQMWLYSIESGYLRENLMLPENSLARLRKLAQKLVADAEESAGVSLPPYERAKLLEGYLRDSGEFGYTLDLSVQDASIDPVEDFLFNRKEGHCEYFASSLALMLRAVGIPARLVSGFKGAEPMSPSRWQVQERHAHAWVEAWTGADLWITLDPTPGAPRQQSLEEIAARVSFWERFQARTSSLWTDYVVQVNLQRQQEGIYGPLHDFGLKLLALMQTVAARVIALWVLLWYLVQNPEDWFSITGACVGFALLVLAALSVRVAWTIYRWATGGGWTAWWQRRRQQRAVVAFYEKFARLAERAGHRRQPTQTPAEFARAVQTVWTPVLTPVGLTSAPEAICSAFYRVRYGGQMLAAEELEDLERQLTALADRLAPGRQKRYAP